MFSLSFLKKCRDSRKSILIFEKSSASLDASYNEKSHFLEQTSSVTFYMRSEKLSEETSPGGATKSTTPSLVLKSCLFSEVASPRRECLSPALARRYAGCSLVIFLRELSVLSGKLPPCTLIGKKTGRERNRNDEIEKKSVAADEKYISSVNGRFLNLEIIVPISVRHNCEITRLREDTIMRRC